MSIPSYRLRRARIEDLEALVRLEALFPTDRLSRTSVGHLLRRANADMYVIETAGAPVADVVVLYRAGGRGARIYSLVVEPAHRGRGLAGLLLGAAELAALTRGCRRLSLEVRPDNRGRWRCTSGTATSTPARSKRSTKTAASAAAMQTSVCAA